MPFCVFGGVGRAGNSQISVLFFLPQLHSYIGNSKFHIEEDEGVPEKMINQLLQELKNPVF